MTGSAAQYKSGTQFPGGPPPSKDHMSDRNELWKLSAADIARRVREREISAEEVARCALARLDEVNPQINAVVEHRPDEVLERARRIDESIARAEPVGPLAGVPVGIKVNVDQAGF